MHAMVSSDGSPHCPNRWDKNAALAARCWYHPLVQNKHWDLFVLSLHILLILAAHTYGKQSHNVDVSNPDQRALRPIIDTVFSFFFVFFDREMTLTATSNIPKDDMLDMAWRNV